MEVDWLKKAGAVSQKARLDWIEPDHAKLPLTHQCKLAGVPRATVYRRIGAASRRACEDECDLKLRALIDAEYTSRPFYGSRRMVVFLRSGGPRGQPKARAAPDARQGLGGHGAWTK
jgi:putative transposase